MTTGALLTNVKPAVAGQNIGLVGAGRMGVGMAINLLRHGAKLSVKANANRTGLDRLLALGANECSTLAGLAGQAQTIILCLPSSLQVEAVCMGDNGLFASLPAGSLILDCTTSTPTSTIALAKEASQRGIRFVDAPVTRSPEHAEQGKLNAIVGADEQTFAEASLILASFCEAILHAGDVGQGHRFKLVYNSMTMGIAAVVAETCQLAAAVGVDLADLRTMVSRGATNSGIFQGFAKVLLDEDPNLLAVSIFHAAKDVGCALAMAAEAGVATPVLASASDKLQNAIAEGSGDQTLPHLAKTRTALPVFKPPRP